MYNVYKITNLINNKIYIGVTSKDINKRFNEHITDSRKEKIRNKRPLQMDIYNFGRDNFKIELIESLNTSKDEAMKIESFWINHYNSFNDPCGYNNTPGGYGRQKITNEKEKEIISYYLIKHNIKETALNFNIHEDTVKSILNKHNIKSLFIYNNKIKMLNLTDGSLIKIFDNQCYAAKWIIKNGLTKSNKVEKVSYIIGRAVKGERPSAYGYKWEKYEG